MFAYKNVKCKFPQANKYYCKNSHKVDNETTYVLLLTSVKSKWISMYSIKTDN